MFFAEHSVKRFRHGYHKQSENKHEKRKSAYADILSYQSEKRRHKGSAKALKNKLCKWISHKNFDHTKIAAKQGNAEERPDAGCEIIRWKAAAENVAVFIFPSDISKADKPRELEGRALVSRQAANLSSKKIANCEYASPQSRTGIVHFFEISFTLMKITFLIESSVGNTALDLVNFLTILW